MYIMGLDGKILAEFDRWDIRSVAKAERWVTDHDMVIFRCSTLITGEFVMIVRPDCRKSVQATMEVCTMY